MKTILSAILIMMVITSCRKIEEKTNQTINKTGEFVGKTTSNFVKGVSEGVEEVFNCTIKLNEKLISDGIQATKYNIEPGKEGKNNRLMIYFVFGKDFDKTVLLKLIDQNGKEYGRIKDTLIGKKDEGKFFLFQFDEFTDIEKRSVFSLE